MRAAYENESVVQQAEQRYEERVLELENQRIINFVKEETEAQVVTQPEEKIFTTDQAS